MTKPTSTSDGQPTFLGAPGGPPEERGFVDRLLDTVEALVVVLDTSGRIVRFNETCEEVTGYAATEAEGKDVVDLLVPPEEQEQVRTVFAGLSGGDLSGEEAPRSHENHWLTKGGERRLIQWSNTILRDEEGRVEHVVGTGIDITKRRRLERKVVAASDEERRQIGAELHDMLAPQLAGTAMMVDALASKLDDEHPEVASEIRTAAEQVREAGEKTRALSHSLLSPAITDGDLPSGLRDLAERQEQMRGLTCSFEKKGPIPWLSEKTASHLYHIASEAVTNAVQHGNSSVVIIRLGVKEERLVLTVRDDGTGVPKEVGPGDGIGLYLMETRADLIGADFGVGPAEGGGTLVRCSLPLEERGEAPA